MAENALRQAFVRSLHAVYGHGLAQGFDLFPY